MIVPPWVFDNSPIPDPMGHGEAAVQWLRRLKHPKSSAKGKAFQLDPWQERIVRRIYGPRNSDGTRLVRRVFLLLPRGNRKTSLCAALTLLHLMGPEREPGSTIVSAASAHEQARELFNEAAMIVENDSRMMKHLKVRDYTSTISLPKLRNRYIAVASDGKVLHGKTTKVVIADELHAWEGSAGRKQWEALDSGLVKVPGTLMVIATTAGCGQENLAWKEYDYALKVQQGAIDDPATLPVIFAADKDDDWRDENVWTAINPGMKHGYPDLASYRDKAKKAINSPPDRDSFLQFNLNVWRDQSSSPFVEMALYDACKGQVDLEKLKEEKRPCWLAVDLAQVSDLTAVVACWRGDDDEFIVHPWFFYPKDTLRERADRDGVPYPQWANDGFIDPTPGNIVDFRYVEQAIRDLCNRFNVQEIAFDPYRAQVMMANLCEDGLPAVAMRPGWITMAPAIAELERVIIGGKLVHDGNPVLRWNFASVAVKLDKAENKSFHKNKNTDHIDGAVACAMAVARAAAGDTGRSIYTTPARSEGLLFF